MSRSLRSPHPLLSADAGCVVSYCPFASALGSRVLAEGGNAIDAAVATALGLAVTYPQAGNLGGGGFMTVHGPRGEDHVLDFRETAPRKLRLEHFVGERGLIEDRNVFGAFAVGVPGTVAGLAAALERLGTFAWDRLVGLAVDLAERGIWLTSRQASYLALYTEALARWPSTRAQFTDDGRPLLPGTLFVQRDLARTLRRLADEGPRAFYEGEIARLIAAEVARGGGVLDAEDLAAYAPVWRTPEVLEFAGRSVVTTPLPSAGGPVLHAILSFAEALGLARLPAGSIERYDLFARILRVAYALRDRAGDPDHLPDRAPACEVLDARAFALAEQALAENPAGSLTPARPRASNTTHFSVVDGAGGAVSCTYSLNTLFGCKVAVTGAGFLLNSSVDDFSLGLANWYDLEQGENNCLGPGHRAVSSMCPTVVTRGGRVEMILGASGGPRIPTVIAHLLLSVLCDRVAVDDAVRSPRVHHQHRPNILYVEKRLPESTLLGLRARGHAVERALNLGIGALIHLGPDGELSAALDPRFMVE
jgi:gamma-glutamyltranspeptidase/glutathione hydrolase